MFLVATIRLRPKRGVCEFMPLGFPPCANQTSLRSGFSLGSARTPPTHFETARRWAARVSACMCTLLRSAPFAQATSDVDFARPCCAEKGSRLRDSPQHLLLHPLHLHPKSLHIVVNSGWKHLRVALFRKDCSLEPTAQAGDLSKTPGPFW